MHGVGVVRLTPGLILLSLRPFGLAGQAQLGLRPFGPRRPSFYAILLEESIVPFGDLPF